MWSAAGRLMRNAVIAGVCGTTTQFALRSARKALGVLPDFQPYEDVQRFLFDAFGASLPPLLQGMLPLVSGALIWSSIFALAYHRIPGQTALRKGLVVALFAWLFTGLVMFPAVGKGVFALHAGPGAWPALVMLVVLVSYCVTLSLVYGWLKRDRRSADVAS